MHVFFNTQFHKRVKVTKMVLIILPWSWYLQSQMIQIGKMWPQLRKLTSHSQNRSLERNSLALNLCFIYCFFIVNIIIYCDILFTQYPKSNRGKSFSSGQGSFMHHVLLYGEPPQTNFNSLICTAQFHCFKYDKTKKIQPQNYLLKFYLKLTKTFQ